MNLHGTALLRYCIVASEGYLNFLPQCDNLCGILHQKATAAVNLVECRTQLVNLTFGSSGRWRWKKACSFSHDSPCGNTSLRRFLTGQPAKWGPPLTVDTVGLAVCCWGVSLSGDAVSRNRETGS